MCYENIINQLKQKETKKKKRYIQNSETWGTEKIEFDFFLNIFISEVPVAIKKNSEII